MALSATVSADPSDPYMAISYTGGQTGTATSVGTSGAPVPGNTVVFTDSGGNLLGNVRLRSWTPSGPTGTAGSLSVAENDDVTPRVSAGDTFQVLLDWRLWPIAPRLVQHGTEVEFYEDYDVGFTDQTVNWRPVAVAGPPAVEFGRGPVTASFVGDRSFALAPGATITNYLWTAHGSVEGTSSSQGTEASPVTFTWNAAGQYLVSLKMTDSNGKSRTNYTWAFIVDPSDTSAGAGAYTQFDAINDSIDFSGGGGECSFVVHSSADVSQFPREALVIHACRGTQTTATGSWPFRTNVLFVGYVIGNSIRQDPVHNTTSFRAVTIDGLMKNLSMHPVSLRDDSAPRNWTMATDITVDRAASFLWHYRSTLAFMTPIRPLNYTAEIKRQDFGPTNLFQQMQEELVKDAWGQVVSDHQSVLHLVRDYNLMTTTERAAATTRKTLHKGIWLAPLDIEERTDYAWPVRKVKMSGIYYPGNNAEPVPYFSEAPGDVHRAYGREDAPGRLILTTQADLNTRCGYALARQNQRWHTLRGRFANDGSFTVAPQEIFPANIEATDNNRGLAWTPDLIPRRLRRTYDHRQGTYEVEVEFEPSSTGPAGVTVIMPTTPPRTSTIPTWDPPPIPEYQPPIVSEAGACVAADANLGVYWSLDKGATWQRRVNGLATGVTGTSQLLFRDLIWDPWWFTSQKKATSDPEQVILWGCGPGFVVRSDDAGKNWENVTSYLTDPPNSWSDSPAPTVADLTYKQIHADIHNIDTFYMLAEWQNSAGDWRGWIAKTADDGKTWEWKALGSGPNTDSFTFSTGVQGWTYTQASGIISGVWDSAHGRTANGCLKISTVKSVANNSVIGYWKYVPTGTIIAATGDTVTAYFYKDPIGPANWSDSCRLYIHYKDGTEQHAQLDNQAEGVWRQLTVTVSAGNNGKEIDYIRVYSESGPVTTSGTLVWYWDDVSFNFAGGEVHGLAMDLDDEGGDNLYLTIWNGNLALRTYNSNLAVLRYYSLGAATAAQITTKELYIVPFTPSLPGTAGFGDRVYVFGRFTPAGVKHIYYSNDAGASFSDVGDASWGASRVGAMLADADGLTLYAFLNGTPALWKSADNGASWSNLGSNPFNVEHHGVSRHADGTILAANADPTAGERAALLASPYTGDWLGASGIPSARLPTAGDGAGGLPSIIWI